jgi:orotate phosphoribosyltransferase
MVRQQLRDLLRTHSYRYDPTGQFRLASGKQSRFYVDCKATTMRGDAAELVGAVVAERVPPGVTAIGGLTMGADPIAHATASYASRHGRPLDAFAVRKEPKKHGTRKWIEGPVVPGASVAVLDDVVTTGASTIDAIEKCRQEGLEVAAVIVLVDRQEEDGFANIRRVAGAGVPVTAIFTIDELRSDPESRSAAG